MTQEIPANMHVKICKKIAQLTKIIYTLNSKAEEQDTCIEKIKVEYQTNVEKIMHESKNKILQLKIQAQDTFEKDKEIKYLQELVNEVRCDNEKLKNQLNKHLQQSEISEKQLRCDYENKYLVLQNKFLERKRDYDDLLDAFKGLQSDVDKQKQILNADFESKHQQELQNAIINEKLEQEKDLKAKLSEYESMNLKVQEEKKSIESDYETKLTKLKAFYEKEIELGKTKASDVEQSRWSSEKSNLIKEFELIKSDLNNRIRFLEKNQANIEIEKKNQESDFFNLEAHCKKAQAACDDLTETIKSKEGIIASLTSDVNEKNESILQMENKLKESYQRVELLSKDTLMKVSRKNTELRSIENVLESTKIQFKDVTTQLHRVQADLSKIKIDNGNLLNKCDGLMKEKDGYLLKYNQVNGLHETKCRDFEVIRNKLEEYQTNQTSSAKTIEERFRVQLQKEQDKHAQNINEFKEESEVILADCQKKLVDEFMKEKEEYMKNQKVLLKAQEEINSELQRQLNFLQTNCTSTSSELDEHKQMLENSNNLCQSYKLQIEEERKRFLDADNMCTVLQKSIEQLQEVSTSEKEKLINEKLQLKSKLEKSFIERNNQLRSEFDASKQALEEGFSSEKAQTIKDLISKHEQEMKNLCHLNEQKIAMLNKEITQLKGELSNLKVKTAGKVENFDIELNELKKSFQKEKEDLIQSYAKHMESMKSSLRKENQHEIDNFMLKKQNALKELRKKHEAEMAELRQENCALLNSMKDQLLRDKDSEINETKEKFESDKVRMQEFLQLQSDEKIKLLSNKYQSQLADVKVELQRSNELRQKEFSVHTNKISDLVKSLDNEKQSVECLRCKVEELENEAKSLRQELELKVQEILEIRRECNSSLRCHVDELTVEHNREINKLNAEHLREKQKELNEWNEKKIILEDHISSLKLMLEEAEEGYRNRPSRDEDVTFISDLQQRIFEQDIECKRLSEEKKLYRLELVNREENFNKVFSTNPNVGFMNPIEIAKRKSARKK